MRFACTPAGLLLVMLLALCCSSRDHVPADCITPARFIELYARIVCARELEQDGKSAAGIMPDAEDVARVEDFVARADLAPATWEQLLARAQARVHELETGQGTGGSSSGGSPGEKTAPGR